MDGDEIKIFYEDLAHMFRKSLSGFMIGSEVGLEISKEIANENYQSLFRDLVTVTEKLANNLRDIDTLLLSSDNLSEVKLSEIISIENNEEDITLKVQKSKVKQALTDLIKALKFKCNHINIKANKVTREVNIHIKDKELKESQNLTDYFLKNFQYKNRRILIIELALRENDIEIAYKTSGLALRFR